jgi:hypothetical protein
MAFHSVSEARKNLSKLDLVLQGEEVVITRRGKPNNDEPFNSAELIRQMRDEGY